MADSEEQVKPEEGRESTEVVIRALYQFPSYRYTLRHNYFRMCGAQCLVLPCCGPQSSSDLSKYTCSDSLSQKRILPFRSPSGRSKRWIVRS